MQVCFSANCMLACHVLHVQLRVISANECVSVRFMHGDFVHRITRSLSCVIGTRYGFCHMCSAALSWLCIFTGCWCAGNGSSSAAPASHPNPAGDVADPPAVGAFTFPSPGVSFGFPAFAGATASTSAFGGASTMATAGSAPATAEDKGKGKVTSGNRTGSRQRTVRVKTKAKAATTAGPTTTAAGPTATAATAATAGAELAATSLSFSGVNSFAGKCFLCCQVLCHQ